MGMCTNCGSHESIARTLCVNCYARMKRAGTLPPKMKTFAKDLFWKTVEHKGTDCVIWPYSKTSTGYGQIHWDGKPRAVHLVMCELTHGARPADKHEAAHSCGNPLCMNPNHIRWATYSEQADDKAMHGTKKSGQMTYNAKLTESDVRLILRSTERSEVLARRFRCSRQSVSAVRSNRAWKHVDPHIKRQPLPPANKPKT